MAIDNMPQSYEHALLLSSWLPSWSPSQCPAVHAVIVQSEYAAILRKHANCFHYSASAEHALVVRFDNHDVSEMDRLVCGIAALQAFVQTNWTGPDVELDPSELFGEGLDSQAVNARAVEELSMHGEPAYHLAKRAGFLWLAREIFDPSSWNNGILKSIPVWRFRCALVNLKLLDTPVPIEPDLLSEVQAYSNSVSPNLAQYRDLQTVITLLIGLYHAQFVHLSSSATKSSNDQFYAAAKLAQLQYELTGRMGKRTKWQIDEKSQLVVLARSRERKDGWTPRKVMSLQPEYVDGQDLQNAEEPDQPKTLLLNDDTLLERPHFTSSSGITNASNENPLTSIDPNDQPVLHPLDQCILLALSLSITNTSPNHGLTTEQIAAFVARVLSDGSQNWSVHSMALLLRSRLEANRTRTVERGLLQIQSLVDQLKLESVSCAKDTNGLDLEKGATPYERLRYFYTLDSPSTWELERELATRFLGLGVVRSALEIFTRLEMWEDVAKCYSSLGEDDRAVKVVKDLLDGKLVESNTTMSLKKGRQLSAAQKAKLWCLLGDLQHETEHYETAWRVSNGTSSRAMRSLGQVHFSKGEWSLAQECLDKALQINPLFGKVWFIMGCAAMRNEDWVAAERAFRRCTSLDDEDGEAWNNLATVVLEQCKSTLATSQDSQEERDLLYSKKRTAYTCLGQAIKHSYDSWRIWVNYLYVSMDVGEMMEACRAMTRLVELRADKDGEAAVDLEVLDRLVGIVVRHQAGKDTTSNGDKGKYELQSCASSLADFAIIQLALRADSQGKCAICSRMSYSSESAIHHVFTSRMLAFFWRKVIREQLSKLI